MRRSRRNHDFFHQRSIIHNTHTGNHVGENRRPHQHSLFSYQTSSENVGEDSGSSNTGQEEESNESEEDETNEYSWLWDPETKSNDVIVRKGCREVYFHPDYSCGTAAVRGKRQLKEGEEHYWEVSLSSAVYGTDMMVGVGSPEVDLNKYKSQFCSIIGKDAHSWGVSYFGTLHHNGKTKEYTKKFERGSIIGCHLDLWKGTLSFYKNGQPLGVAFDGLLGKKLYPIVSSTAARTKMKLLCSYSTTFSLQYLCCNEISKIIPSTGETLDELPIPQGLKRYLSWRMKWVLKLNNPDLIGRFGPERNRVRRRKKISSSSRFDINNN